MILNFPLLHWYICFETFNFLFSSILILLLWSDVLVLSACVDPMYISLHSLHSIMYNTFFESQLEILFILNLVSGFLKGTEFTFYNYITYFASFNFAFGDSLCCVFFPNVEEVNILFRFWGCLWLLMIFVVSSISLILSLFSCSSCFFIISVNSPGLFLLWVATYTTGFSLLCFLGFLNSPWGIYSNSNPLFITVVGYPLWCRVVCSSLSCVFLKVFINDYCVYSTC